MIAINDQMKELVDNALANGSPWHPRRFPAMASRISATKAA